MHVKPINIIKDLKLTNSPKLTANNLRIHISTVYRWRKKALSPIGYYTFIRTTGLKRLSTKPNTINYALDSNQTIEIINLRRTKGYCARKIKKKLKLDVDTSTIHRLLKRKGLVNRYGNHIRPRYQ